MGNSQIIIKFKPSEKGGTYIYHSTSCYRVSQSPLSIYDSPLPIHPLPIHDLKITQISLGRQRQQRFVHQFDGVLYITFMQHLHRGMHIPQRH